MHGYDGLHHSKLSPILELLLIIFFPQSVFRGFLDSRSKHISNQIILCTDCSVFNMPSELFAGALWLF